ncbi:MAG TPA: zinc metallopeptidase, partial [Anaerolineaceae bacterium]|nr:zinc metallopeptidase [Anaerolineaceae bacterium]
LYVLLSLPALLLGLWAQSKIRSSFSQYSRVRTTTGLTGAEVARRMLDQNGLTNVRIEQIGGNLTDHYDPAAKVLRLSQSVYNSPSVAAAGVAAHESGHAIQDRVKYGPLKLRSLMVPTVKIGSWFGPILFVIGLAISGQTGTNMALLGLILFSATALFALVTLPVEFDASKRAKAWLLDSGILYRNESEGISKVLDSAALTYVAGAAQAISTVLYYALLLMGRSNRDY